VDEALLNDPSWRKSHHDLAVNLYAAVIAHHTGITIQTALKNRRREPDGELGRFWWELAWHVEKVAAAMLDSVFASIAPRKGPRYKAVTSDV
jgi:hypothetical protein